MNEKLKALANNQGARERLLKAIFGSDEVVIAMEMTSQFTVTDEAKFRNIIAHIQNDNGILVAQSGDKFSMFANDTICNCVPLDVPEENVREYDGDYLNTLKLIGEILPDGEMLVLQGTSYTEGLDDITSTVIKVTNKELVVLK